MGLKLFLCKQTFSLASCMITVAGICIPVGLLLVVLGGGVKLTLKGRVSCHNRKCHRWASEGLAPSFGHSLKVWSVFSAYPPLNVTWRGSRRGEHPLGVVGLMLFIDHSDRLRRAFGTRVFKKHAHWWCVMSRCSDPVQGEGRSCMKISPISTALLLGGHEHH